MPILFPFQLTKYSSSQGETLQEDGGRMSFAPKLINREYSDLREVVFPVFGFPESVMICMSDANYPSGP